MPTINGVYEYLPAVTEQFTGKPRNAIKFEIAEREAIGRWHKSQAAHYAADGDTQGYDAAMWLARHYQEKANELRAMLKRPFFSVRKVGGIWFAKLGRINVTLSVSKKG
jgi:hypothetical protein